MLDIWSDFRIGQEESIHPLYIAVRLMLGTMGVYIPQKINA